MARKPETEEYKVRKLIALVRQKAQHYLKTPGVTSVGVGYRLQKNENNGQVETTNELCIQFTVAMKLTRESLENKGISPLPESLQVDNNTEVPVQVIERSFEPSYEIVSEPQAELTPRQKRRSRLDPVVPGISISHKRGSAGTIGAVVYDNETGVPLLLSNWHVLQGVDGQAGDDVVQPGPHDDGDLEKNRVGRLVRSHLGLAGDCAVVSVENRRFAEEVLELNVAPKRAAKVSLGDNVVKSGRTTGVTYGVVTRVGVTTNICYRGLGVREIGCFEIRPNPVKPSADGEISKGGDSGSIWLIDGEDVVVGLHFAGEVDPAPSEEHALSCNIHSVLEKLSVSLVDNVSQVVDDEELWNGVLGRLDSLEMQLATDKQRLLAPKESPQQVHRTRAAVEDGFHFYGNWCGPGHGSGEPIDDVDRACMVHDKCYDRRGYFNSDCDDKLVRDIDRALDSGNVLPWGHIMGPLIRAWFKTSKKITRAGKNSWKIVRS